MKIVVKVVKQCRVSPPPSAVSPIVVPLTFFDVVCLFTGPFKRLFSYQRTTITTAHFISIHLPALCHSLSLTLQPFFSLAGNLSKELLSIDHADGDSVSLVISESEASWSRHGR